MADDLKTVRDALGHASIKWRPSLWLDTGLPDLNEVLGHRERGLSYGRIIELFGWESNGKTATALAIAALGQHDGAHVDWGDVENSFDPPWAKARGIAKCPKCAGTGLWTPKEGVAEKECPTCGGTSSATCGLDPSKLTLVQPYVGNFSYIGKDGKMHKEKKPRLSTAQELLSEIEMLMENVAYPKRIVVIDSVAALLTEGESLAGIEGGSTRTDMDLPIFMGRLLRRWVGLAQVHNALIILINQMRGGPSKGYGSNERTTGGNAPKFYAHVRIKVRRAKGGRIMEGGRAVGFLGVMKCLKNKVGGTGEGAEIGFRLYRDGRPLEFVSASEVKKKEEED